MNRMKRIIAIIVAAVALLVPTIFPISVAAQNVSDVCEGVGAVSGASSSDCTPSGGVSDINSVVEAGLRIFQVIVGIIAFVMIIIAGQRFITSGGDPAKVTSARNTIIFSVVGVVIIALAEVIIQFALNQTQTS